MIDSCFFSVDSRQLFIQSSQWGTAYLKLAKVTKTGSAFAMHILSWMRALGTATIADCPLDNINTTGGAAA